VSEAPLLRPIAERRELAAAVERWRAAEEIALDTEFVFERTFRPRPGLVQVAIDGEVALVDAVALPDLSPLAPLLADAAVRKRVHAGGADVALVRRLAGEAPHPVLDTQVAAAFAGLGGGLSYAAVVRETQGVDLAKAETRTDWTRRPLRPEQLRYAAEDVAHLLPAARALEARLAALGRLAWAEEESARILAASDETEAPWERLRGLGALPPRARAAARELAVWREREAERLDLARPFLLRDETLLALARREAVAADDLRRLPGWDARRHERHAESWLAAHRAAVDAASIQPLDPDPPRPGRAERERRERRSRAVADAVAEVARALALPAELLLSRKQRERLLADFDRGVPPADHLIGFRRELLAEPIARLAL
jgi:ribonuclease D